MRAVTRLLGLALAVLCASAGWAQDEPRLALLIGNEAYPGEPAPLSYPHRDISRLTTALEGVGFTVRVLRDGDRLAMLDAIETFAEELRAAGSQAVGFFYFAGHGAVGRSEGARRNFMLPADTRVASETALIQHGVRLDLQIEALRNTGARAVFVVYDACRNEFSRGTRGFQPISPRAGLLIALSTTDGSTAPDDGRYAAALADEIARPGQDALLAFARATQTVGAERLPDELPTILPALTGPFCFNGCDAPGSVDASVPAPETSDTPIETWRLETSYSLAPGACSAGDRACAITSLDWSPRGSALAAGFHHGLVRVWRGQGDVTAWDRHSGDVLDVSWSPDGERLVSVGADRNLIVWRPDAEPLNATSSSPFTAVDWSSDGRRLFASDTNGSAMIWDLRAGGAAQNLRGQLVVASDVAWSPDGAFAASASRDGRIRIWRPDDGPNPEVAQVHPEPLYALAWSPDGDRIAAVGERGVVRVMDFFGPDAGGSVDLVGHFGAVSAVAWSPDGRQLVTAGADRQVRVWDVDAARPAATLQDAEESLLAVAWSADGSRIAAAGAEGVARVWRRVERGN